MAIEPKVWGLDYPFTSRILFRLRCCPSSLYTFPSEEPPKGLARDRHVTGFPEFEQFYAAGFPARIPEPLRQGTSPVRPQKQKKLEIARRKRLVMVQHNQLVVEQRIELVYGRHGYPF